MSKKINKRPVLAAIALAALLSAPVAIGQDAMTQWMTDCLPRQEATQQISAANAAPVADRDPYLQGAANKQVGQANPFQQANGVNIGSFSCNSAVKGAFDQVLSGMGSWFGFDFMTLFSGIAGAEAGNLCGQVGQAIGKTFGGLNVQCPRINIPGFNNSCGLNIGVGANGVSVSGSGTAGGYSVGGTTNTAYNGVFSGNGSYNAGQGNTGSGSVRGNATTGQTTGGGSGWFSNVSNQVGCWLNGGC